jgi:hypothetical protein
MAMRSIIQVYAPGKDQYHVNQSQGYFLFNMEGHNDATLIFILKTASVATNADVEFPVVRPISNYICSMLLQT